jgi:hypothetical protein
VARLLLLVLLVAVGGLLALSYQRGEAAEDELAAVAGEIAGRAVRVECQGVVGAALDVTSEAGTVQFDAHGRPSDTAELKRGVCTSLRRFRHDVGRAEFECVVRGAPCPGDVLRSVWAVHTLAHEAWHLAGETNEAITECRALQTTAWTASQLGATPDKAQAVARYVARHMYPSVPADYRSPHCRDGGALDLRPSSPIWP